MDDDDDDERPFVSAYESSDEVRLVFSVNNSGHFQGYAKMCGAIGRVPAQTWEGAHRGIGGTFKMEWLCLYDLPFTKTTHLVNRLNGRGTRVYSHDHKLSLNSSVLSFSTNERHVFPLVQALS